MEDESKNEHENETTRRAKLMARRDALNRRLAAMDAKAGKQRRNQETRRNILAGACIRNKAANDEAIAQLLDKELRAYLTRPDDRVLFHYSPLATPAKKAS